MRLSGDNSKAFHEMLTLFQLLNYVLLFVNYRCHLQGTYIRDEKLTFKILMKITLNNTYITAYM